MPSRYLLLALALAVTPAASIVTRAAEPAQLEAEKTFDLPAQPLATALLQFSFQSDVPVIVAPRLVAGKVAPEVRGAYTPSAALARLLAGSGLKAERQLNGGVTIALADDHPNETTPSGTKSNLSSKSSSDRGTIGVAIFRPEEIIVTGTLLKRSWLELATPVTVLKDDYLKSAGRNNAERIVDYIHQAQMDTTNANSLGAGNQGAVYANLRGLGDQRTLVLLDGKRMVNSPYTAEGVDLNSLPLALLDHVEVLADGASSIYGSDAIAGVINFITKKDFEGLTASIYGDQTERGGGQSSSLDLAAGYGSLTEDRWNLSLSFSTRKQRPLTCSERGFCDAFDPQHDVTGRTNPFSFPATYFQTQTGLSSINPYAPGCTPPFSIYANGKSGPVGCVFNTGSLLDIIAQQFQYQLQGKLDYKVAADNTLSLQYVLGHEDITMLVNPTNVTGISMTSNNPFYPGNGITPGFSGLNPAFPITINMKDLPMGGEIFNPITNTDRILLQDDGSFWGFDYSLWAVQSDTESIMYYRAGFANTAAILPGFSCSNGVPCLNAFGPQTPAGAQYFYNNRVAGPVERVTGSLRMVGGQISRDLFNLPGGPVSFALANDYRRDTAAFFPAPALALPLGSGPDGNKPEAGRDDDVSVTAEANIPVLANLPFVKKLEIGASVRMDDYDMVGAAANPAFTLRYQPSDEVVLRGSYTTGFRVPTLYELYAPITITTGNRLPDPVLCPGGVVNIPAGGNGARDCGFLTTDQAGGNPKLSAELSSTVTGGIFIQPLRSLTFSADYWYYYLKHTVSTLSDFVINGNATKFDALIVRCNSVPAADRGKFPTCAVPGGNPIAYYETQNANLGNTQTNGIDFSVNYGTETPLGLLDVNYRSTWVWNQKYQLFVGGNYVNRAGTYHNDTGSFGGVSLPYVHYLTFDLHQNDWSEEIRNKYEAGYNDCNTLCGSTPNVIHKVSDYWLWDVFTTYSGYSNVTITAGIQNIAGVKPPVTNATPGEGYSPVYPDLLGRNYSLRIVYKMK